MNSPLSDAEQASLLQSIRQVRQKVSAQLNNPASTQQSVMLIEQLYRSIDKVVTETTAGEEIACQAGCAYCCSSRVEISEPEAFLLALLLQQLSPPLLADIKQRLTDYAQQVNYQRQAEQRIPCIFLRHARCTVYPFRPAACRKAHSLSLSACQQQTTIPQNLTTLVNCEALIEGTRQAYQDHGLSIHTHELGCIMLRILEDDTLLSRWLNGEQVFTTTEDPAAPGH